MPTDTRYKSDAKGIVDSIYDAKIFKDTLTRDDISAIEEYIEFCLKSNFESYKRVDEIMKNKL